MIVTVYLIFALIVILYYLGKLVKYGECTLMGQLELDNALAALALLVDDVAGDVTRILDALKNKPDVDLSAEVAALEALSAKLSAASDAADAAVPEALPEPPVEDPAPTEEPAPEAPQE